MNQNGASRTQDAVTEIMTFVREAAENRENDKDVRLAEWIANHAQGIENTILETKQSLDKLVR